MNAPIQSGYDKSITAFSPDGRLLQVEYAREAIKRGTTAIGIKAIDGIILLSTRQIPNKLIEVSSIEKISQIDDQIAAANVGMTADARILIEKARIEAQINIATYDEPIGIEILTKKVCDFIYAYTQSGGIRPFGTSLLIAGIDNSKSRLFETDPSGAMIEYKSIAIGKLRDEIIPILEKEYNENINIYNAIQLGIKILNNFIDITPNNIEIVVIEKIKKYYKLSNQDITKHLEDLK